MMKRKILTLSVFALYALTLFTGEVNAFGGGLFSPHNPFSLWNRHNRYTTQISVRPYNAFTPICWGNLVCDGVCPAPCGVAAGCLPMQFGVPPFASIGGCSAPPRMMGMGMNPGMYGYYGPTMGFASDMPAMPIQTGPGVPNPYYHPGPGVPMQLPDIRNQPGPYIPPIPVPIGPNTMYQQVPSPVTQANFQQGGYPMYNPSYYHPAYAPQMGWPQYQQAPSYWYGSGR